MWESEKEEVLNVEDFKEVDGRRTRRSSPFEGGQEIRSTQAPARVQTRAGRISNGALDIPSDGERVGQGAIISSVRLALLKSPVL